MKQVKQVYRWIMQHEMITLALVGIVFASLWGFVELADEVLEGDSLWLDRYLLLSLRNPADATDPIGPSWVEEMARDVTAMGSVVVLTVLTAITAGYLKLTQQRWIAIFVVLAIVGGTLVSVAMKSGFDRPRPDLVPHETRIYTQSFPSGHSAMSAMVFLTLGALVARIQATRTTRAYFLVVAFLLTASVGVSRVYLGVHWPTDVVAGWTFGVAWAAGSWLVFRNLERRFTAIY
ncbi:phosphatase PAP2 family protein [Neorhodopirellula lusitana]|uniref:phosphatase PAP2 family protein n=1 Tax=Neorhodopirellula lusitana TaxID=445327 RepID=UPI00384E627E